jgi:hypothetical protein
LASKLETASLRADCLKARLSTLIVFASAPGELISSRSANIRNRILEV